MYITEFASSKLVTDIKAAVEGTMEGFAVETEELEFARLGASKWKCSTATPRRDKVGGIFLCTEVHCVTRETILVSVVAR